jgi:hypothetical protein
VSSHCKILGNENAEALAKMGSTKEPPSLTEISYHTAKNMIKKALKTK